MQVNMGLHIGKGLQVNMELHINMGLQVYICILSKSEDRIQQVHTLGMHNFF
jgi:hypothetical protein